VTRSHRLTLLNCPLKGKIGCAFSGVQSATGHRFDIAAISGLARAAGAIVFIDGSQMVGAVPAPDDLRHVDVLVAPDHKFFGPAMNLSATASRFDSSISWLAAIGNQAALAVFDDFGPGTIYARNRELTGRLRRAPGRPEFTQVMTRLGQMT
jgi:aminotransferase class V